MDSNPVLRYLKATLLPCALILLSGVDATGQGAAPLRARRDFALGERPQAILAADVDGDLLIDLVAMNQGSGTLGDVHILKGFGDGTFRRTAVLNPGSRPTDAAFVDVNADGKRDLVTVNLLGQEVAVLLGDGLGGFGPPISTRVSGSPVSLAVGDWNGDGRPDVATANNLTSTVTVLIGTGTGAFTARLPFGVGSSPKQIVTGDFNRDSIADLAVASSLANNVQIWRGSGTGSFTLANTLAGGGGPSGLAIGDINADTRLDVAIANTNANTVTLYLGNNQGGFGAGGTLNPGLGPRALALVDLNKDTRLDLLVGQSKFGPVGELAVLNGNGNGTFAAPVLTETGPTPGVPVAADFNRDGNLDVAVVSTTGWAVAILRSTGTGGFVAAGKISLASGSFPHAVVVDDFNRDGRRDIASANEFTENVTVCLGNGAGGCATVNSANNTGITPFAMLAADFNRDTCADLVTANNGDGSMSYLLNNCAGNFTVTSSPVGCTGPVALSRGEISGDLFLDLAFVCEEPAVDSPMCTRRGTGAGGSSAFGAPVCTPFVDAPMGIALGPYSVDALEDAAVTSDLNDHVAIAVSDGSGGTSDVPATFAVGANPKGVVRDDINGDGFADLLVANSGASSISVLLGDGGGIFSVPPLNTTVGQAPTKIAVADYNLDGKRDAAVVNTNSNNVALLLGDGAGHFSLAGYFGTRSNPISIAAGDLDSDGKPDLAVADNFSDSISILINQLAPGDPLAGLYIMGTGRIFLVWGIVPGATYDVIRGLAKSVRQTPTTFDLGPVTCLAADITETDTANYPDDTNPPVGDAYFYAVRATVNGNVGSYTVSVPAGKPGVPASGDCP
jgi:hypothetical protein